MNIVFLGTPDFSVPSLRALHSEGHEISLVITRPDKPRGRGRKPSPPAVKRAALELGLDVYQPESVNHPEARDRIQQTGAELGIVVAYGEILPPELLEAPPRGFLNLHASLLPKYRGAAPIHWAIIRGEKQTGITIQRIMPELDSGPILQQRTVDIGSETTVGELHDQLARLGAEELSEVVNQLDAGHGIEERAQDDQKATRAPKLKKSDGEINWYQTATQIERFVRGVTPWPGAQTTLQESNKSENVILTSVKAIHPDGEDEEPGTVITANTDDGLRVQTGDGAVIIERIKPANSREMDAADFLNGYRVDSGDRFE